MFVFFVFCCFFKTGCNTLHATAGNVLQDFFSTLQVRMYCSSRPKQPGFSFEALFPDDLFPPGNKAKGEGHIITIRILRA